jgi:hypothetical protein
MAVRGSVCCPSRACRTPAVESPRDSTSICKIFEGEIGQTGPSEKVLRQLSDTDFEKLYFYPNSHAGYHPGAKMIAIKVLFRKKDGRLLGAQPLSEDGVAKRVDAFAMAIQMNATVYDLEEAEKGFQLDVRDPPELASKQFRARSTSRCRSCAPASASCPATRRSRSPTWCWEQIRGEPLDQPNTTLSTSGFGVGVSGRLTAPSSDNRGDGVVRAIEPYWQG